VNLKVRTVIVRYCKVFEDYVKEIFKKEFAQSGIDFVENSFRKKSFKLNMPANFI